MVSLKPGILLKLAKGMKNVQEDDSSSLNNYHEPTLLQVRSIVPIMEHGDLWPNKGFHVKVCDSSHAMYVSLPQEMDDLILGNNLKLGQFMYVEKIKSSYPVPTLVGVTPLSDCQPCIGSPEEIDVSIFNKNNLANDMTKESRSDEETEKNENYDPIAGNQAHQNCIEKQCVLETKICPEALDLQKPNSIPLEKESDSDSPKGSSSRRRSWGGAPPKGASPRSNTPKPRRSRSAGASPVRAARIDSSDDNSSSTMNLRAKKTTMRSANNKSRDYTQRGTYEPFICNRFARHNDKQIQGKFSNVEELWDDQNLQVRLSHVEEAWDNLPSDLLKLGKEVIKKRDAALLVAIEALQEAAIAERLLKCLSIFSDIHEEKKVCSHRPLIQRFLDLQSDVMHSKLILESLTNISPLSTSQSNHALMASSVKAAISLAIERKKNAASWINAAAASDIPPFSDFMVPVDSKHASKRTKKSGKGSSSVEAKKKVISVKLQDKASENIPALDKENSKCWTMGSAMSIMTSLADSLLTECRRWFLPHLEKILDEYPRKSSIKEPGKEIAEMMRQIKRVNDWLDMIISKVTMSMLNNDCNVRFSNEQDKQYIEIHNNVPENSITEVCERVRSKIYKVLLEHVQKNAVRNS